jgi:hypothetical protein
VRARVEFAEQPPIDLRIALQPEHARDADRYLGAAVSALQTCTAIVGRLNLQEIALRDPRWNEGDADTYGTAVDRVHWWTTEVSMAPELAAARGVSRRCWRAAIDASSLPSWFVEGLAEFTARRAVVPIFERGSNPPGYAFLEQRSFAGFVPRIVRIRLMPETDGEPISEYRARQRVDMQAGPVSPSDERALTGKIVLALGTLERWVGRPVFDEIAAEFVRSSRSRAPRLGDFEAVASAVSGQQLSWFFDQSFRSSGIFDYGLERFESEPASDGGFVTTVIGRKYGDAQFTGADGARTGRFENGRGITLRISFENGQHRTDWWDGRDERRTWRYRSPVRAVSATIDPDHQLLLDLHPTNNSRTLAPQRSAAATRWAIIYLGWLEHLLLSYLSLA